MQCRPKPGRARRIESDLGKGCGLRDVGQEECRLSGRILRPRAIHIGAADTVTIELTDLVRAWAQDMPSERSYPAPTRVPDRSTRSSRYPLRRYGWFGSR